jgi:hypothetical protein
MTHRYIYMEPATKDETQDEPQPIYVSPCHLLPRIKSLDCLFTSANEEPVKRSLTPFSCSQPHTPIYTPIHTPSQTPVNSHGSENSPMNIPSLCSTPTKSDPCAWIYRPPQRMGIWGNYVPPDERIPCTAVMSSSL